MLFAIYLPLPVLSKLIDQAFADPQTNIGLIIIYSYVENVIIAVDLL